MINASYDEVRPATHTTSASPPYNNNNSNSNNTLANKLLADPATTHDNQSIASHPASNNGLVTPLAAATAMGSQCATTIPVSVSEATDSTSNASLAPMNIAWQTVYQQQQQQQSAFKTRPFPIPPSITIPPHPGQTLFSDLDVSTIPSREFGKMSPVFGPTGFSDSGLFALSPQNCQLSSGSGSNGAALLLSPVKVNGVLRATPVAMTTEDGGLPASDASPAPSPIMAVKDQQFNARFVSDAWAFDSGNMYAMVVHPPQPLDLSYQAMLAPQQQQHINPQIQFQFESQHFQLQHPGLGIHTTLSPPNARMHQVYPQMSPMATSPHQLQMTMPSHHAGGAFSPTVNLSMINFSELMMLGGGGDNSGLFIPQSSPTSKILKHMLPPVVPHHGGVHVKDITLNELRPHFNKPMAVVAKELGVCITLMKKICRRNGLVRWPHRRIRSLVNRITSLQVIAAAATEAEKKRFESQIAMLREELSAVIQNPNEKSRKAQADAKARSPSSSFMAIKDEEQDEDGNGEGEGDGDNDEADQRTHIDGTDSAVSANSSGGGQEQLCEQSPEDKLAPSTSEPVNRKEDANLRAPQNAGDPIRGPRVSTAAGGSKKRKFVLLQQFNGGAGTSLYPPPPIKIPCYRDGRPTRRNSAPEQQHLRALGTFNDLERPSSTTSSSSNKRGSISSILCD